MPASTTYDPEPRRVPARRTRRLENMLDHRFDKCTELEPPARPAVDQDDSLWPIAPDPHRDSTERRGEGDRGRVFGPGDLSLWALGWHGGYEDAFGDLGGELWRETAEDQVEFLNY